MELGLVGLGRMGRSMATRLLRHGHSLVVFDLDAERRREVAGEGARGAASLEDLVDALPAPRTVWLMLPHGAPTESTLDTLTGLLDEGDVIVEGGNSRWTDSKAAAERVGRHGLHLLDVGVSGGVWGPKVIAALRKQFGGHAVREEAGV